MDYLLISNNCNGLMKLAKVLELMVASGFAWSPMTKKFEAEDEVWEELIRPNGKQPRFDTMTCLMSFYASDCAAGKKGLTSRQVHNVLNKDKQPIDLNDAFNDTTMNDPKVGDFDDVQFSTPNVDCFSPENAQSNQSTGTSGSRGTKRKALMVDLIESQMDKMTIGIDRVADALISGNALSEKLNDVAQRQVTITEQHVVAIEKRNEIIHEQLTVLKQSRTRKKRLLFEIPPEMRFQSLLQMMYDAGQH
ncbi:hypothetical protein SESBI_17154 [Sesbania bispinosa]|nr:hypothetical protein SESBI_17154 [Sesbania bispinosa]